MDCREEGFGESSHLGMPFSVIRVARQFYTPSPERAVLPLPCGFE
jgi:hypothetical protein